MRAGAQIGYLMDVEYLGQANLCRCSFLNPLTNTMFYWYDTSGHKSYLLTDASEEVLNQTLGDDYEYLGFTEVEKYNAVLHKTVKIKKVFGDNPLTIGGDSRRTGSFRRKLENRGVNVWEANIRYKDGWRYDQKLEIGMPYIVSRFHIIPIKDKLVDLKVKEALNKLKENGIEENEHIRHWLRLFETPLPDMQLAVVDVEVLPESEKRMPNARIAMQPVIAVCVVTSDGIRKVLVLRRQDAKMGRGEVEGDVIFFNTEEELLIELFRIMREYFFIVTFNGDAFDLAYLYNRANRLGIDSPIRLDKLMTKLESGIHLDLYPFFKNPSIKNYAFGGKYKEYSLDAISTALINEKKIEYEGGIGDLSLIDLAKYCMHDGIITYKLTTFGGNIVTNLIMTLARMSNQSPYIITRMRIGEWIKSTFFYILRDNDVLIPNVRELASKGDIQTEAMIKGKKYKGAIVADMAPGVYFNVVVMDFASLYPTEIKERNIGYSTINCGNFDIPLITKKLIWVMLHLYNGEEERYQKEKMKLMRNIEKEIENIKENIEEKTEKISEDTVENDIENLWQMLHQEERHIESKDLIGQENGIIKLEIPQNCGKETKNIRNNMLEIIKKLNGMSLEDGRTILGLNFSSQEKTSVKSADIMTQGFLRFIMSMVTNDQEKKEIISAPWLMRIGINYNSFVQIVTELSTRSDHWECMDNIVPDTTNYICTKERALESLVIGGLRDIRVFIYKPIAKTAEYFECLQQAIKVFINASYGVFGNEGFGLYCAPVAEAIAAYSRNDMGGVLEKAKNLGILVIGGDTDSVFLDNPTIDETEALQKWAMDDRNLDLGIDKVYRYGLFSERKKNYLGILKDGTVDIKGLSGMKSNTPIFIRRGFEQTTKLLSKVENREQYEAVKEEIEKIVIDLQRRLIDYEFDVEDLSVDMRLSKNPDDYETNPQHVKAAKMLINDGYEVRGGDLIKFVKTTSEEGVAPVELAKPEDVNVDKYLENVKSVFEQITDAMDIEINLQPIVVDGKKVLFKDIKLHHFLYPRPENEG